MSIAGHPDLIAGKSPSATMLKGFSASIPASSPGVAPGSNTQGQRTLSGYSGKDFGEKAFTPTCGLHLSAKAVFFRMLLEFAHSEASQPGEVVGQRSFAGPILVLAEVHVEHPVQRVLDSPV